MISIDEARAEVLRHARPLPPEGVSVEHAVGRVLAEPVVAAADAPPFDNSAMDGYAALAGPAGRALAIVGESRAGAPFAGSLGDGQAIRVSTGAAVPAGAQVGVLQVEKVRLEDGVVVLDEALTPGRNIRRAGEDVRAGTVVLEAGAQIGPAQLGAAIAAGASHLTCGRRPTVAIVNTGDELVPAGTPLAPGQIHNSNGPTLAALAALAGAEVMLVTGAGDSLAATESAVERALLADVVVISGGVSVGPHDHVKAALAGRDVQERFWRVAVKPGKPTWFGTQARRLVFGLPGNPVSAYVTFVLFVRPALRALQGADPRASRVVARLSEPVERNPTRDECVRVTLRDGLAAPTGPQGSHISSSLAHADGLALIERGDGVLEPGSPVSVEPL